MLKISKEEWGRKIAHGYAHYINGQPYILTMEKGATVLAPVEIEAKTAAESDAEQASFFDTIKGVEL